jgi:hypothetical protein
VCAAKVDVTVNAINPICLFIESIVIQFVYHVNKDEQTSCKPDSQAKNVDGRIALVLPKIAHGNLEIIFKHKTGFYLSCLTHIDLVMLPVQQDS